VYPHAATVATARASAETVVMNNPMNERRAWRRELLRRLYAAVDGSVSEFVSAFDIGAALDLDEAETRRIFEYLEEKGWVMVDDHRAGIVRITANGIDEVESAAG
jgi:hypothetical protein